MTSPGVADGAGGVQGTHAAPTLIVPGTVTGRCRPTAVNVFGDSATANTIALAALTNAPAHLAKHRTITFQSRCADPLKSCTALLAVLPAGTRYRAHGHVAAGVIRRSLAAALGTATFVVAAGTSSTQTVALNARGRALARAGKLHQATLVLGSVGAKGKIVLTTRTVRLR